jgi:hypothetical protein
MALIPNRAISEDVSNPKPKRTPRGYIFHGLHVQSASTLLISCSTENIPINELERPLQDTKETASAFDLEFGLGCVGRRVDDHTELLDEFVQNEHVHDSEHDQEGC